MRTLLPAVLACLALASAIGGRQIAVAIGPNPAKAPAPAVQPPPAGSSTDNDAPARHARRRACLKDAKSKKLVGAQRDAYVKNCVGNI